MPHRARSCPERALSCQMVAGACASARSWHGCTLMPKQKQKHRRRVTISVVLPASVEVIMTTDDPKPSEHSDWTIESVLDVRCEATVTAVNECGHDEDFADAYKRAAQESDLP